MPIMAQTAIKKHHEGWKTGPLVLFNGLRTGFYVAPAGTTPAGDPSRKSLVWR
jgi:hypothetical protein